MDLGSLRGERHRLAHAKRRIIYNNDGDDTHSVDGKPDKAANVSSFLARRTTGVQGTQVDTISYCVVVGFGHGRHNTRVCDLALPSGQGVVAAPGGWNHPEVLLDGRRDCLEIIIDFCREHGIEVWASIRMNDTHDQWQLPDRTPWKAQHPERWLGSPPDMEGNLEEKAFEISEAALGHPERWGVRGSYIHWYGVNYARQDVRDKMFEILSDLCARYDIDGIELDYLRTPIFFRANAQGNPDAGERNRDKMTGFMRRVRKMTEEVGIGRDRPVLTAIRVPDSPEVARAMGLDTPWWLAEGLVDIFIAGNCWQIRPWQEPAEFAHRHDVPFYACVIDSGGSPEVIRGRALSAWAGGADGIYTFNHFDPKSPLWNELGDPQTLLERDRTTLVEYANLDRANRATFKTLPGGSRFLVEPPRLPLTLPEGRQESFDFVAGEDGERLGASCTPYASLHLQFVNLGDGDEVEVTLNDNPLSEPGVVRDCPGLGWIACRLDPSFLRWGENRLTVRLTRRDPNAHEKLELADVQLHVTAQPQEYPQAPCEGAEEPGEDGTLENIAFLITGDSAVPPPGTIDARKRRLLDELNLALPVVPRARLRRGTLYLPYPPDPSEKPLPGWASLAILFDSEKVAEPCAKELMRAFFQRLDSNCFKGELGLYAGHLAGTEKLAGLVVASRSLEDMDHIARRFGEDAKIPSLMPLPVRFLRARGDGHLIPRGFAIVFRGTLRDAVFTQAPGCWEKNLLSRQDLAGTHWRLA